MDAAQPATATATARRFGHRMLPALLAVIAALSLNGLAASAQRELKDEGRKAVPSESATPSRAVGGTHNCAADYPEIARRQNLSGDVQVRYDVAADGTISNVTLVKSSGHDVLDRAAIQCVASHWRNTPATKGGIAVASPGHQAIIRYALTEPNYRNTFLPSLNTALYLVMAGLGLIALAGFLAWLFERRRRA